MQPLLEAVQRYYPIKASYLCEKREQRNGLGGGFEGTSITAIDILSHNEFVDGNILLNSENGKLIQGCRSRADATDDNKKNLEIMGVACFIQFWQSYEREHWNESRPLFEAIVTEPSSALTQTHISSVHAVRTVEPEINPEEIEKISYFCCIALKPGGYAVVLAGFSRIYIWRSILNRSDFKVMSFP